MMAPIQHGDAELTKAKMMKKPSQIEEFGTRQIAPEILGKTSWIFFL